MGTIESLRLESKLRELKFIVTIVSNSKQTLADECFDHVKDFLLVKISGSQKNKKKWNKKHKKRLKVFFQPPPILGENDAKIKLDLD